MEKRNTEELIARLSALHPNAECELNFSTPFELLVAVVLSAQCTDKRVNEVTKRLFPICNTPKGFVDMGTQELEKLIYQVGFYRNKAASVVSLSRDLLERFGSVVPDNMEELLTLRGVGRKTASVVLEVAFGIPAMPVDTHVFRVAHRLGLSSGKTPEEVERDLCSLFPEKEWGTVHHLFIFHGRYVCKSQKPDCEKCTLKEFCTEKR